MARMRRVAQAHRRSRRRGPASAADAFGRQAVEVAGIGEPAEAKAERRDVAVLLQERQGRDRAAGPVDAHGSPATMPVLGDDRRIFAAGRRLEAIAEARLHDARRCARRDRHRSARRRWMTNGRRSSMPWVWSACSWVNSTPSSHRPRHASNLLAQVGRGVDQDAGDARAAVAALDQQRAAAAAVFRIGRVAGAPAERRPRHARGRAAAQDGERSGSCRRGASVRGTLLNRRKKFSVVWRRNLVWPTPRTSASTLAVSTHDRPARCVCRDNGRARDRARRSRPGCGRPAGRRRCRAGPRNS